MPLTSIPDTGTDYVPRALGKAIYDRQLIRPAASGESSKPRVLLVMASDGHSPLLEGLAALGIEIARASSCSQARRILAASRDVRAVVTDLTLPDGNWRAVLDAIRANCVNTEMVIVAPSGKGGLRRHLRESGVYDLLAGSCRHGEVARIVGGAVLTSYRRHIALSRGHTQAA